MIIAVPTPEEISECDFLKDTDAVLKSCIAVLPKPRNKEMRDYRNALKAQLKELSAWLDSTTFDQRVSYYLEMQPRYINRTETIWSWLHHARFYIKYLAP